MTAFKGLQKQGLINADTGDLRDLIKSKTSLVKQAYCASRKCAGKTAATAGVRKYKAKRNADWCHDCGNALIWRWRVEDG